MAFIFESENNVGRHAGATTVHIDFDVRRHTLALTVSDNGKGLNDIAAGNGLGLRSMRARAERLRGQLEITSLNGSGTRVSLLVPLTRARLQGGPLRPATDS